MKKNLGSMNSLIDFTFLEINALNKLLGQIKSEAYLNADEINFFALSPFIISAFEKIHKEHMNQTRNQTNKRCIQTMDISPQNDFQLTDMHYVGNRAERIKNLNSSGKEFIQRMDNQEREEFCDLIFAPFKPTVKQHQDIIETLESIANEAKK